VNGGFFRQRVDADVAAKMHGCLLWRTENRHSRAFTATTRSLCIFNTAVYPADMVVSKTCRSYADLHCRMQPDAAERDNSLWSFFHNILVA